jgi:hypothetical protein
MVSGEKHEKLLYDIDIQILIYKKLLGTYQTLTFARSYKLQAMNSGTCIYQALG